MVKHYPRENQKVMRLMLRSCVISPLLSQGTCCCLYRTCSLK